MLNREKIFNKSIFKIPTKMRDLYLSSKLAGAKLAHRTIIENAKNSQKPSQSCNGQLGMYRLAFFKCLFFL